MKIRELLKRNWLDIYVFILVRMTHHVFKTINVAKAQVKFQQVEHPVTSIIGVPFYEKHVFYARENVDLNNPHEKTVHVLFFILTTTVLC